MGHRTQNGITVTAHHFWALLGVSASCAWYQQQAPRRLSPASLGQDSSAAVPLCRKENYLFCVHLCREVKDLY